MSIIVSYLLPSYNHAHFVVNMLRSIKEDIDCLDCAAELIIIDDASTDNSVEVINNWLNTEGKALNILFLPQIINQGIAATLNLLVSSSKGTYLRLTSSDDCIIPGSTDSLYEQFQHNSNLLCVLGDGEIIDENDKTIASSSIAFHRGNATKLSKKNFLIRELIQHWCVAGPSFLIKKEHLERVKYNEKEKIDDYQLFLSLLEQPNSIHFVNEKVCYYRVHTTNTSKTSDVTKRINNLNSFLTIINCYIQRGILEKFLFPVKYKTIAKISFLQKNYLLCAFNMIRSLLIGLK